jgi:SOS-response transcriptional repressor LexA
VDFRTTKPVARLGKSHINLGVVDSSLERKAIERLESLDVVDAYVPNSRGVGLTIPYEYQDARHVYEPDFVIRVRGGRLVMLETKGGGGEFRDENLVLAKNAAARKWVAAVNNAGRYGRWAFEICRDVGRLRGILEKWADGADVLPFRLVAPRPEERYRTCVPLSSLRAAAGGWAEEQAELELTDDTEWVSFDTRTRFEEGMFVARVQGSSMEPEIPSGSYCLFRSPRGGSRQGRRLLIRHSGISDPETGGEFTLKVYTSEKVADPDGDWEHVRIVLKPLNPAYEPIELAPLDEGDLRMVAEFVEVVGK